MLCAAALPLDVREGSAFPIGGFRDRGYASEAARQSLDNSE